MNPKITAEHLNRGAVVYVRQSTLGQVAEHTENLVGGSP
jgi:predicted RecA/RadA family phage recombinase